MALLDRYLQAVKFWLPRKQKDDIIAELAEDLRSQIEEKEAEVGHKLSDPEIEPILKRCGSPMVVAGRYLPQTSLIGPALFPIYRVIIRSLFLYFLLPWLAVWIALALFSPGFRAAHPGGELFATLEPWWLACTYSLFFNTLIFALLSRSKLRAHMVENWNPRSLPAVRDPNKVSRGSTVFELVVSVAMLAIWFEIGAFRRVYHVDDVTITLSHMWPYFFWALVLISLGGIGVSCLHLANPRWTPLTACLRFGIDVYASGLIYWICRANVLQSLAANGHSAAETEELVRSINFWLDKGAIGVLAVGAIIAVADAWRMVRVGRAQQATGEQGVY